MEDLYKIREHIKLTIKEYSYRIQRSFVFGFLTGIIFLGITILIYDFINKI